MSGPRQDFQSGILFPNEDPTKPATSLDLQDLHNPMFRETAIRTSQPIKSQFSACANAAVRGTTQTTSSAIFISLADKQFFTDCLQVGSPSCLRVEAIGTGFNTLSSGGVFIRRGFEDELETLRAAQLKASSR